MSPRDLVESACPLCGSDKRRIRWRLGPAWVAACQACGLRYAFPRLSADRMASAYADNPSDLPPERDAMLMRLMQARADQVLAEAWPCRGKKWLELGCGFGHCLAAIRAAGFEVEGTELAREQIRHAREKFGLYVHSGDIASGPWPQPSSTFDVIASFEVIEHLDDPMAFLRGIFARLNPGGQIMLSTPNYSSLYRYMLGRHWYYHIPTQHLSYFTAADLRRALTQVGFTSLRSFTSGRSLLAERGNVHNTHRPDLSLDEQWHENARQRSQIEIEREGHDLAPPRHAVEKAGRFAAWHLGKWAGKWGLGDQLRIYALKP